MSSCIVQSGATKNFVVGNRRDFAESEDLVAFKRTVKFSTDGDGSADLSAPDQLGIYYIGQTGVVNVNLNSITDDEGVTRNFAGIREISLEVHHLLADGVTEADDAAVVIVGNGASTPFVGDWSAGTVTVKVQKGTAKVLHIKAYGAPLSTSGANVLKLDFGAYTLVAKLIIKGNE